MFWSPLLSVDVFLGPGPGQKIHVHARGTGTGTETETQREGETLRERGALSCICEVSVSSYVTVRSRVWLFLVGI